MPPHSCHARGCNAAVPPRMFMCRQHWRQVPRHLQDALGASYVPGQERRKDPTDEYLEAAHACIEAIAPDHG